MRDKKLILLLMLIAVSGLLLSLFLSFQLPIWLDERYSLVFANQLNIWELLFHSKDVHPGVFYVALKALLQVTTHIHVLRFFLSILPQWIGCVALTTWTYRKKLTPSAQVFLAAMLFLNPFIVYSTIHLRMYGMAVLFSVFIFVSFYRWLEENTTQRFLILVLAMLCANSISYAFFFITAGVALCLITQSLKSPNKNFGKALFFILVSGIWFWVLAGFSVKRIFEAGSWIPLPSITNVQSLVQTIMGFETNYFLLPTDFNMFTLIFYSFTGLSLRYLWKASRGFQKYSLIRRLSLYLVIYPVLSIFCVSLVFPILSQQFFFYQFIPKLSVFLPRVFVPIVIFSSALVAESFSNFNDHKSSLYRKSIFSLIGSIVLIGWTMSYLGIYSSLRAMNIQEQQRQELVMQFKSLTQKPIFVLPSWVWLRDVQSSDLSHVKTAVSNVKQSESQESILTSGSATCGQLQKGTYIFVKEEIAVTIDAFYEKATSALDRCCEPMSSSSSARYWSCGK